MSRNKNVGRGAIANAGLVLQGKTEIDRTESGMLQSTLRFHLLNEKYPELDPARATPCDEFTAGDSLTTAILAALDYLGAQTSKFIRSGFAPGIGILDVLCQGAVFDVGVDLQGVADILVTDSGTDYTESPTVNFIANEFEVSAASAHAFLRRSSQAAFTAPGTGYAVGDIIAFDGGTYTVQHKERVTAVDGSGGIVSSVLHQYAEYTVAPSNPISTTAETGVGSGATVTTTWEVRNVVVDTPGEYLFGPAPLIVLSGGGSPSRIATCTATMGEVASGGDLNFTEPFAPVTTVKDTLEFFIYGPATPPTPPPAAVTLEARVCTTALPLYSYGTFQGRPNCIIGVNVGAIGPQDGVSLNAYDIVFVNDGSNHAGVYQVILTGFGNLEHGGSGFVFQRVSQMDESSEVTDTLYVSVAEGVQNSGLWVCTVGTSFTINTDNITFQRPAAPDPVLTLVSGKKVTLDYHAIELHFEYMSREFQSRPRFIQVEYQRDADGSIIIDPLATPQAKMKLEIDSLTAIAQTQLTDADGNVTIVAGPPVSITEADILSSIKYVGTSAQFEQVPAGQFWHVTEQTTIKVQAIVPVGSIGA